MGRWNRLQPALTGAVLLVMVSLPVSPAEAPVTWNLGEIYATELFHGPELQGIEDMAGCSSAGIGARTRVAPPPASWFEDPIRHRWIADPL